MKNHFEVGYVSQTNILHTQYSNLANYGAKKIKVSGPFMWNNLPENIRNSNSINIFKFKLKIYLLEQYISSPRHLMGHYYVSKLSSDFMKITIRKMNTFFVPPFLPPSV